MRMSKANYLASETSIKKTNIFFCESKAIKLKEYDH